LARTPVCHAAGQDGKCHHCIKHRPDRQEGGRGRHARDRNGQTQPRSQQKRGDHFEVELVFQDQSGKTIGAVGIVFMYEKGKEAEFQKKAEQVREEMKQKTPTIAKLFEPAD